MFKQKLFLILCLSIILTSVHSEKYKYACADELEQGGLCYLESEDPTTGDITAYVKKCGKGKTCYEGDDDSIKWCIKDASNELGEEDDKCKVNEECISKRCVSGKCKYLDDGAECDDNEECKPSSYCSKANDKCKAYSKAGEKCDNTDWKPCINGYVCGKTGDETELKCIEKYSVEDGTVVSDQSLCKSGQITRDNTNKCVSYTLGSTECDASDECSYKIGDNTSVKLDYCDTKSDGKTKACREINGDLWNKYVEAYQKRLKKIKDDKDYNRHSSKWDEDNLGDRDVSDAYVEWQYNVLFSDASKCVKDYLKQEAASSNFIVFNLMIIVSFALILI